MPKKMPLQPAFDISLIKSSSMQSVRALQPQQKSSFDEISALQNSATFLRSTVNMSWTRSKLVTLYLSIIALISAITRSGDFKRNRRRKKSLVEQKLQAKGQPLPNSRAM